MEKRKFSFFIYSNCPCILLLVQHRCLLRPPSSLSLPCRLCPSPFAIAPLHPPSGTASPLAASSSVALAALLSPHPPLAVLHLPHRPPPPSRLFRMPFPAPPLSLPCCLCPSPLAMLHLPPPFPTPSRFSPPRILPRS